MPLPSWLASELPDLPGCKLNIPFPGACCYVLVSPSFRGSFWGLPPQSPHAHSTQEAFCASICYILKKKKKKSAFHFNDDTTQRWGSCYRIQGIWAEVIGVIKSSSRGIPSFLHKLPIWELCVISHYRREWLCLTSAGRENLSHFSFSRERELGSIDMEFLLFLQFLAFSWCI